MLLVKKSQSRTLLFLEPSDLRKFRLDLILHFVIGEWILLALFTLKIYMEKVIKCLKVVYENLFYLHLHGREVFIRDFPEKFKSLYERY